MPVVPRIDVPDGQDPLMHLWTKLAPGLTPSAAAFTDAVYKQHTLPIREFEAARTAVANVNDCNLCLTLRSDGGPDETFYAKVATDLSWDGFSERERLAAEFAHRFAIDHLGMDEDLWDRLHAAFSDTELVELALCVGSWLAFGRLNRVFDVDGACRIPPRQ